MATREARPRRSGPEICYVVLIAQLAVHIVLQRGYFRLVGQSGDIGSNYLAFWAIVLVPATILFAAAIRLVYRKWVSANERRQPTFFVLFGLIDVMLLLLSFATYTNRFQG